MYVKQFSVHTPYYEPKSAPSNERLSKILDSVTTGAGVTSKVEQAGAVTSVSESGDGPMTGRPQEVVATSAGWIG